MAEQGGYRHGFKYDLPGHCKTTIRVPKALVEQCKQAAYDLFKAYMLEQYGVATLEQLSPADYYEALQKLGTMPSDDT